MNIPSYMGGVDLWQNDNDHDDDFSLQSIHDKILEVVCISGTWHLGKLQVQIVASSRMFQFVLSIFYFWCCSLLICSDKVEVAFSIIFLWLIGRTFKGTPVGPRKRYKIAPPQFISCSG